MIKPFDFSYSFPRTRIVGIRYNAWVTENLEFEYRLGVFWYFGCKVFSWKQ